jgi:hypothetical protein
MCARAHVCTHDLCTCVHVTHIKIKTEIYTCAYPCAHACAWTCSGKTTLLWRVFTKSTKITTVSHSHGVRQLVRCAASSKLVIYTPSLAPCSRPGGQVVRFICICIGLFICIRIYIYICTHVGMRARNCPCRNKHIHVETSPLLERDAQAKMHVPKGSMCVDDIRSRRAIF